MITCENGRGNLLDAGYHCTVDSLTAPTMPGYTLSFWEKGQDDAAVLFESPRGSTIFVPIHPMRLFMPGSMPGGSTNNER